MKVDCVRIDMGAMGLIGIMIKALAGGTNAAATALTVWSGMDWAAKKGADLKASEELRELADMISCENVAGDLDPYDTAVKEYIEGHQNKLDQVILTEEYRKEFLDIFYKANPQYLVHHEKIDNFLGVYLDRLEAVLQKRITLGDKFILQGQSELKKMDQELMAKQDQSIQIMEELISEWRQFKQRHDSAPVPSPSHPSNLDSLSFYKVRQLTDDLWVNWETGLLGEDFDSVRKMADDTNDNTYVDTDGSTDGDKDANVKDGAENGRRRLSPSQVRLLSVLVQGEGAVVSWKELFWRGRMLKTWREQVYDAWRRKGADSAAEKDCRDELSRLEQRVPDNEEIKAMAKKAVEDLCREFPSLDSVIYRSSDNKGCGLCLSRESFTGTGKSYPDLYQAYGGCSEDEDWERLRDEAASRLTETEDGFVYFCRDKAAWLRRYYNKTCHSFEDRISNARGNGDENERENEREREGKIFGNYTMAQVYMNAYAQQEGTDRQNNNKAGESASAHINSDKAGYSASDQINSDIIGNNATNATMSGSSTGNGRTANPPAGIDALARAQGTGPEALLDLVENWLLGFVNGDTGSHGGEDNRYGHVLVLHGQPGDGKTTFCKKAVYAHCKEGWLKEVPHVLLFSLNPADNKLVMGGKLSLSKVLCVTEGDENRYFCDINDRQVKEELKGTLLILDGYDEVSGDLAKIEGANTFNGFCNKVEVFAKKYKWNVIITSRTMCIEGELKTMEVGEPSQRRVAAFAPMSEEQQEAMIDRMIQLDGSAADESSEMSRKAAGERADMGQNAFSERSGTRRKATLQADVSNGQHLTLGDYKEKYLRPVWENMTKDDKIDDFKELLKVPTLFRMIVARRFTDFERTKSVAVLYGRLFHSLLSYKAAERDRMVNLVKKYEDFAIRIFNYDDDTCPFTGEEAKDKDLLYLFYTKKGREDKETGAEGRLGFLHRLFYQYFLARYIVSVLRKRKMTSEGQTSGEVKAVKELFAELRVEKLTDPDLWKLVAQLAELEQEKGNYPEFGQNGREKHNLFYHGYADRIQKAHIEQTLGFLNDEREVLSAMLVAQPLERSSKRVSDTSSVDILSREPKRSEKRSASPIREAENAIFNLLSACAAVEQGLISEDDAQIARAMRESRTEDDYVRIAYADFANVCELLHRGDYSGIYLEGVNLDHCHLEDARLRNARLAGVRLNHAELPGADLYGANLAGAFLQHANIKGANLAKARLDRAHMEYVMANELSERVKNYSVPSDAVLRDGANFAGASLKEAHLDGAYLAGAVFDGADLRHAHLEKNAILTGASLVGADLREARFDDEAGASCPGQSAGAELHGANLSGANLEKVQMKGVNLTFANLKNALIAGADLNKAQMDRANLTGASLEGAELQGATFTNARLDEAYLRRAKIDIHTLKGLEGASLRAACLGKEQVENAASFGITDLEKRVNRGTMRTNASHGEGKEIHVGDTIEFGCYPQEHKTATGLFIPEPLRWRVLHVDREKGRALVITEKLIDRIKYHDVFEDITWEYCTLRKWMNTVFIREAFTTEELSQIAWVWNENEDNCRNGRSFEGGNATRDRVFALSIKEAQDYFKNSMDRRAAVTSYAEERDSYKSDKYKTMGGSASGWWWLRSPGIDSSHAALVFNGGDIHEYGHYVVISAGPVRPALWLNL